jgi:hypothetical protein
MTSSEIEKKGDREIKSIKTKLRINEGTYILKRLNSVFISIFPPTYVTPINH